jgi:excisionase family DNA binding protein
MNGSQRSGMKASLPRMNATASPPESKGRPMNGSQRSMKASLHRINAIASPPNPREAEVKEPAFPVRPTIDLWTHRERYVTPAELARYWRVSTDTIYRDIKKGALPAYRIGSAGTIRIRIEDARRYGRPEV